MIKKSRVFLLLAIVSVAVAIGYAVTRPDDAPTAVTAQVALGSIAQTVEVTGAVETVNNVDLAFNASGTVSALLVSVGDTVTAGETVATLEASDLAAAVAQAREGVVRARAELDARLAGVTVEQTAVGEADVAVAKAALETAEADVIQVRAVQDASVASATQALAQAASDAARAHASAREDLVESIRSAVAEVRHALSDADTVLGIENVLFNQDFKYLLGNQGIQTMTAATNSFRAAIETRNSAESAFSSADAQSDDSVTLVAGLVATAYADASQALLDTLAVLDATASNSDELSLSDITAFKSSVSSSLSALIADGTSLTNASQALEEAVAGLTDDVAAAENALAAAVASRDRAEASAESAVASRSADLARAQASLASLIVAPRSVDVASLRASVGAAEAEHSAALARLQKTQIIAPIDGVVTDIAFDPGESASAGVTAITVLSSGTAYEVTMDIPESDVSKISVGNAAEITFDALGDARTFEGTVAKIDPAQKLIEGVVYYEAKVSLVAGQDLSLVRPGMSSNVSVRTAELADAIFVPSRSVLVRDGAKYVRVQAADGTIEERSVRAGLYADGGKTQILSGLEEGETVVVSLSKS